MLLPKALEDLIEEFIKFPGIGRKTAERYALHMLNHFSDETMASFGQAILDLKKKVHQCPICGLMTDRETCDICANEHRDSSILMVVESSKDVFSIEKGGEYKGKYHVLNGVISPMNGIGPEDINLAKLWPRITDEKVQELIIATSSTQEGETTALYIHRILKDVNITVSRIGYGVPVGLNLEYADDQTLSKAIQNRRKI